MMMMMMIIIIIIIIVTTTTTTGMTALCEPWPSSENEDHTTVLLMSHQLVNFNHQDRNGTLIYKNCINFYQNTFST
jgi:hypothetical protein